MDDKFLGDATIAFILDLLKSFLAAGTLLALLFGIVMMLDSHPATAEGGKVLVMAGAVMYVLLLVVLFLNRKKK